MGSRGIAFLVLAGLALGVGGVSVAACTGDDPTGPLVIPDASTDGPNLSLSINGTNCSAAAACQSGLCVDGVCCDSACNGTCERCDVVGTVGRCSPTPDGQNPDKECPQLPLAAEDAGSGTPPPSDVDAGDDAGPSAPPFVIPDGGVPATQDTQCAGVCNGSRACRYPSTETTCGVAFCGNMTEQGRASCDATGRCRYGVEECSAFACADGSPGCKTTCSSPADCLAGFFCDGNQCKPQLANGTTCTSAGACTSGNCFSGPTSGTGTAQGVCCDSPCTVPAATCSQPGDVGKCHCSACTTGPCVAYYIDRDNDGHGDKLANANDGTIKYGCADATPAGYSKVNDDCFDTATAVAFNVHPGQTGFFTTAYLPSNGVPSFDYDCSNQIEKETTETAACVDCKEVPIGIIHFDAPNDPQSEANGTVPESGGPIIGPGPGQTICTGVTSCAVGDTGHHACFRSNGSCTGDSVSFAGTVGCGNTASTYGCSACSASTKTFSPVATGSTKQQGCH